MGKRSPGPDGRRAWARLTEWQQAAPGTLPHPNDGTAAVEALGDIGLVRRLLDQAELTAVRTARAHGKSWSEIAIQLGVTRQSAWEKWRDLDDADRAEDVQRAGGAGSGRATTLQIDPETFERRPPDDASVDEPTQIRARAARELRRRSTVAVPKVIGLPWGDARLLLQAKHLVAVGPDPDTILAESAWPDGVVTDQSPESGAKVPVGSPVTLWIERDGGSGVREPRRPRPNPKVGRELMYDRFDESVG
jgi:hypothetical protein